MFDVKQKTEDYMSLVVTHECNKKCPFCIDKYRGSGEFVSLISVKKSLEYGKKMGVKDVLIVGGEPTIHPMIVEICQLAKSYGFRLIMTTNYTKPDVVARLDGIIDCFNISFYNQRELPNQKDFESDLTLHTLIHGKSLSTKEKLDDFIFEHSGNFNNLKFSTISVCNDWTERNQSVPYLDSLDCEWVVLFNEILGQKYGGIVIKRYDRVINKTANQSIKAHVDGEVSFSWERS